MFECTNSKIEPTEWKPFYCSNSHYCNQRHLSFTHIHTHTPIVIHHGLLLLLLLFSGGEPHWGNIKMENEKKKSNIKSFSIKTEKKIQFNIFLTHSKIISKNFYIPLMFSKAQKNNNNTSVQQYIFYIYIYVQSNSPKRNIHQAMLFEVRVNDCVMHCNMIFLRCFVCYPLKGTSNIRQFIISRILMHATHTHTQTHTRWNIYMREILD